MVSIFEISNFGVEIRDIVRKWTVYELRDIVQIQREEFITLLIGNCSLSSVIYLENMLMYI